MQPNISRVLAYAEQQLGFALLDRHPSELQSTSRAQLLISEINQLYFQLQRIDQLAQLYVPLSSYALAPHDWPIFNGAGAVGLPPTGGAVANGCRTGNGPSYTLCQELLADRLNLALTFGQSLLLWLPAEVLYLADMVALIPSSMTVAVPVSLAWLCEHHPLMMQPQDPLKRVLYRLSGAQGRHLCSCGTLQIKIYSLIADMVLACSGVGIVDTFTARRYAQ